MEAKREGGIPPSKCPKRRERERICYKAVPGMFSLRCHRHHHHRSCRCRVRTYVTNISFFFYSPAAALPIPMSHHVLLLIPVPAPITSPSLSPTVKKEGKKKSLQKSGIYPLLLDELKQPSSSLFLHSRLGMNFSSPSAVDEFLFPFNPIPFHSLEFASFTK